MDQDTIITMPGGREARYFVSANAGHPWNGAPGWDLLEVICDTQSDLDIFLAACKKKFWDCWIAGACCSPEHEGKYSAVLYKPSGARSSWVDANGDVFSG